MDDKAIIALYFSRSEQAITETKTKYDRLCMKIANAVLQSPEDSEECVNTSYLKIWNAIPPKNPESFCAYLCRIVKNTALSLCEKASKGRFDEQYDELDEVLRTGKTVEDEYDSKALGEALNGFLKTQKRRSREIFIARYYFNMPTREIAMSFDMTDTAVRSRLARTREQLRKYLSERGVNV